jgi:two-component system NtrC family sensor kinase
MTEFFTGQMDYIFFFYGLAFLTLTVICFILARQKIKGLPWLWLGLFGLLHGSQEWIGIFHSTGYSSYILETFSLILSVGSFLSLLEFGRGGIPPDSRLAGRVLYVPLVILTLLGGVGGLNGIDAASRYTLALTGGMLSSFLLFRTSRQQNTPGRRWLAGGSFALGLYALITGIVVHPAGFPPASVINSSSFFDTFGVPVQLVKGILAACISLSVWAYAQSRAGQGDDLASTGVNRKNIFIPAGIFVLIIVTGWILTEVAGNQARNMELRDGNAYISALANHFTDELSNSEQAATGIAAEPAIVAAMKTRSVDDLARAGAVLRQYVRILDFKSSHAFLIDTDGMIIDASDPEALNSRHLEKTPNAGRNFKKAAEGVFSSFYAVDEQSMERFHIIYYPVRDEADHVVGIVEIKKNMSDIEASFKKHANCFLVDPNGIIFLSSRDNLHFMSLGPLSDASQRLLADSGQFGPGPFPSLLSGETGDGRVAELEGQKLLVTRRSLGHDNWSLVLLNSSGHIRAYRIFSIFTTFVFYGMSMVFFAVIYFSKDSAERVAASERRYRSLVEGSPDCVALFDADGRCLTVNRSGTLLTGLREGEIVGRRLDEIWHKRNAGGVESILGPVLQGSKHSYESESLRPDGRQVLWSAFLNPLVNINGRVSNFVGIFIDITERKRAEEELKQYHENLEDLVRDRTRELSDTNQRLQVEIKERLHAEEELQRHRERLEQLVEERTTELRTAVQLLTNEINFRKNAEETLKESESKFRRLSQEFHTLLDAMTDELLLVSSDLKILWANKAFALRVGRDADELTGESFHALWFKNSEQGDECHALKSFSTGRPEGSQISTSDGRLYDVRAFPIRDEGGAIINLIMVVSDITEKVTLQSEAMRAGHLASLGELSAGVAHEINNPITGIINYAQIIANKSAEGSRENDIARRIVREGERIAGIVRSLLSFARERREDKSAVRFTKIVMDSVTLTAAQIRKDGIRLGIDLPDSLPEIMVNPQQIQQVILNIISNARYALNSKYPGTSEDKILEISGSEVVSEGAPYVRMVFIDHGMGIPSDIMEKIINPFFSTKPVGEGTGLGLSISHGIISDHGGKLKIESQEGYFTSVIIDLPAKERDGKQA